MGKEYSYEGDYELPEFYNETLVKARKQHKCYETGTIIYPGESYYKVVGKWDGDFQSYSFCMKAMKLIHKTNCSFGGLKEFIDNIDVLDDPDLHREWNDIQFVKNSQKDSK